MQAHQHAQSKTSLKSSRLLSKETDELQLHCSSCVLLRAESCAQADQQAQSKAKQELKAFLLSNEENKRLREQAKEQEKADNLRYMAQHAEILAKEEKASPGIACACVCVC